MLTENVLENWLVIDPYVSQSRKVRNYCLAWCSRCAGITFRVVGTFKNAGLGRLVGKCVSILIW